MNNNKLISVVIPVYNSGIKAISAIDSVLAQDGLDMEIIVVDDGSFDDSFKIINNYIKSIKIYSIKLIKQENQGAASARNTGVAQCQGELIAFLDSDDQWLPGKLAAQLEVLREDTNVALVGTLTNARASKLNALNSKDEFYYVDYRMLLLSNRFQTSTVLIRADALVDVGVFNSGQRYAEEGDLFLRLVYRYRAVLINKVFVDYGDGKASFGHSGLSSNLFGMWRGELSNLYRANQRKEIGKLLLMFICGFSLAKFLRRLFIVLFRKIWIFRQL